jgi:hypothetical protein
MSRMWNTADNKIFAIGNQVFTKSKELFKNIESFCLRSQLNLSTFKDIGYKKEVTHFVAFDFLYFADNFYCWKKIWLQILR